jgi:hypothetical protein
VRRGDRGVKRSSLLTREAGEGDHEVVEGALSLSSQRLRLSLWVPAFAGMGGP